MAVMRLKTLKTSLTFLLVHTMSTNTGNIFNLADQINEKQAQANKVAIFLKLLNHTKNLRAIYILLIRAPNTVLITCKPTPDTSTQQSKQHIAKNYRNAVILI